MKCNLCQRETPTIKLDEERGCIINRCLECGLVYLSQGLNEKNVIAYYKNKSDYLRKSEQQEINSFFQERYDAQLHIKSRITFFKKVFSNIADLSQDTPLNILDVGCNVGILLDLLTDPKVNNKLKISKLVGIDPNIHEINISKQKGHEAYCTTLEDFNIDIKFDLIIMNDVLEHLSDPFNALSLTNKLLTDKGVIFIRVPNITGILFKRKIIKLFKILRKTLSFHDIWAAPEHLYNFNFRILELYAGKTGFNIIKKGQSPHELYSHDMRSILAIMKNFIDKFIYATTGICLSPNIYVLMRKS
jgi:2-polyprenyl-3-methyl-5-hydroxy-6-metoxy-1,4-benzoquinol methylase